jgi:hypothetical protein
MPLCCLLLDGFLLGLLFNPGIGGNMFLQNLNELLLDYMKLHPRTRGGIFVVTEEKEICILPIQFIAEPLFHSG